MAIMDEDFSALDGMGFEQALSNAKKFVGGNKRQFPGGVIDIEDGGWVLPPQDLVLDAIPHWVFTEQAWLEITKFEASLSDEEYDDLIAAVNPPTFVLVETKMAGFIMKGVFGQEEKFPNARSVDGVKRRFSIMWLMDVSTMPDEVMYAATGLLVDLVCVRTLFRDRFVEKLTKHQERNLRRYGMVSDKKRIITVAWDAPTPTYVEALDRLTAPQASTIARGAVCQHEVRGHPRKLRSGTITWVSAHRRGDPNVERKTTTRIVGHVE
jgi:hypothetical protein